MHATPWNIQAYKKNPKDTIIFSHFTFVKTLWWNEIFTHYFYTYFSANYLFINILWHTKGFFHSFIYLLISWTKLLHLSLHLPYFTFIFKIVESVTKAIIVSLFKKLSYMKLLFALQPNLIYIFWRPTNTTIIVIQWTFESTLGGISKSHIPNL